MFAFQRGVYFFPRRRLFAPTTRASRCRLPATTTTMAVAGFTMLSIMDDSSRQKEEEEKIHTARRRVFPTRTAMLTIRPGRRGTRLPRLPPRHCRRRTRRQCSSSQYVHPSPDPVLSTSHTPQQSSTSRTASIDHGTATSPSPTASSSKRTKRPRSATASSPCSPIPTPSSDSSSSPSSSASSSPTFPRDGPTL